MRAIWVGTMSLVPKLLLKIRSDLGRHQIFSPTQIASMGAIWVGSDLGTYRRICYSAAVVTSQVSITNI